MTQEEKQLLLKDLSARFPYGVKVEVKNYRCNGEVRNVEIETLNVEHLTCPIERYRPYLRPMDSMTEEEKVEYGDRCYCTLNCIYKNQQYYFNQLFDWLNEHHFDYRGLIPAGLAIAVTEENNPYKE